LAVVIVHGPVYVLSAPLGPVFDGPGKHPPHGSGPSATFPTEPAQPLGDGDGDGDGDGEGVGVGDAVGAGDGDGIGVAVGARSALMLAW